MLTNILQFQINKVNFIHLKLGQFALWRWSYFDCKRYFVKTNGKPFNSFGLNKTFKCTVTNLLVVHLLIIKLHGELKRWAAHQMVLLSVEYISSTYIWFSIFLSSQVTLDLSYFLYWSVTSNLGNLLTWR